MGRRKISHDSKHSHDFIYLHAVWSKLPMKTFTSLLPFFLTVIVIFSCDKPAKRGYYMPAEWEPHDAIWFGWEDRDSLMYPPVVEMIRGLEGKVPVRIAVSSPALLKKCKQTLSAFSIDTASIGFYVFPGERYWIRDHGAAFLVNDEGGLGVADFRWSLYGMEGWLRQRYNNDEDSLRKYTSMILDPATGAVDSLMAVSEGAEIVKADIVSEGGAIEVNGNGTLILCEAVAFQRNPGRSRESIENAYRKALGVTNIVWLKEGLLDDAHWRQVHFGKYLTMGTGGHTDEFVRFVDPNTILLAWVDEAEKDKHPLSRVNYDRMSENLHILENAVDQDGKPFRIIKLPLPDPIERNVFVKEKREPGNPHVFTPASFVQAVEAGDTLINVSASSYMNYLVSNGVVLLPSYTAEGSSAEKEKRVSEIFATVYPDREQVWISCMPQNWHGGGIHCSTQQQPTRKK